MSSSVTVSYIKFSLPKWLVGVTVLPCIRNYDTHSQEQSSFSVLFNVHHQWGKDNYIPPPTFQITNYVDVITH